MKKYLYNNWLLIIYFIIYPFIIILLDKLNINSWFMIFITLVIVISNCALQSKKDPIFNTKNMRIYCLITATINSAVSSLLIFVIRLTGTVIVCNGINSASLMDLSWFSLFLLCGFIAMFIINYISYEVVYLLKKIK